MGQDRVGAYVDQLPCDARRWSRHRRGRGHDTTIIIINTITITIITTAIIIMGACAVQACRTPTC
jgi:acyl-CoA synthetase (AMP-forming)/AMP-acid ligase II